MTLLRIVLAASLAVSALAAVHDGEDGHYYPPYEVGPSGGDEFNLIHTTEDGRIVAGRAYPLPSFLSCDAKGGYSLFELTHHATAPAPDVSVDFSEAAIDPYVFITVNVIDADGEFLGATHQRGPLTGNGQLTVPLAWPDTDEFEPRDVRVQFGLEMTSACPSADAGTAKFDEVHVGH